MKMSPAKQRVAAHRSRKAKAVRLHKMSKVIVRYRSDPSNFHPMSVGYAMAALAAGGLSHSLTPND